MLSTTVTLTGTAAADAFGVTLNGTDVQFYVDAALTQTVPASQLAGLTIDGGGGADTLAVTAAGVIVPLDATATPSLALTVAAGTVQVAAPASLPAATVAAGATLDLTAPGTLSGPVAVAGTLQVDNGTAAAATSLSGAVTTSGSATLDVTAGTLAVPGSVADGSGSTLALDGPGTLAVPAWTVPAATVIQTAGIVSATTLTVGGGGTGTATYDLDGGSVTANILTVGGGCTGRFTQSGGTLTAGGVDVACSGFAPSSDGVLAQTGGTSSLGGVQVGDETGGVGRFDLSGGTSTAAYLNLGTRGGTGAFVLSGPAATTFTTGDEQVGYADGTGSVVQTGGTNTAQYGLYVGGAQGSAGVGGYDLSAGTLADGGPLFVGYAGDGQSPAVAGNYAQSGGAAAVAGPAFLSVGGPAAAAVSGGTLAVAGNVYVGYSAAATLALTGTGSVATADALYVTGDGTAADGAGAGTLTLSGSAALTTRQTVVGHAAPATFTQTGGTHTTQTFVLDGPAGRFAAYAVTAAATVHAAVAVDAYAPAADGPAVVDEGAPYALSLFGNAALTAWQVDWGDGEVDVGTGGWAAAPHTYLVGGRTFTIVPAARDGNQTYPTPPVPVFVNDLPAAVVNPGTQSADAGQAVSVAEPFTDPGVDDAHTATVDWGDGSPLAAATIVESGGSGTVAAAHVYAGPGTYAAELTVSDKGGAATPVPFTVVVAPAAPGPSGLTATPVDDEDVQLAWTPNPADPNTTFEVDRQNADGSWADLATVDDTTDGDAYADTGLSGATTYNYRVRSVGSTAATDSAYVSTPATTPLTVPDAPTGLAATESTAGEVDLTWADDSDIVTGYGITATPAGGGTAQTFADGDGYDTAFAATGLTPGAVYSFAVTADNDQGNGNDVRSAPSGSVTAVAPAATLSADAPATVDEGSSLTLSLSAAAPAAGGSPVTAWQVTWADGAVQRFSGYTPGATLSDAYAVPATATSDAATVVATDAAGDTFTLPEADTDVVPLAPTGVTATAVSDGEVDLAWTDNSTAATGVEVLRADAGSADYADVADLPAGTTAYADTDVEPGTQYSYAVAATGGSSGSAASAPAAAASPVTTSQPGRVQGLTAAVNLTNGAASSITLNWTYSAADATGFEVEVMQATDRTPAENFSLWDTAPGGTSGTYTFTGEPGQPFLGSEFHFRVRADRADGTVSDYAAAKATATADAPAAHATAVGGSFPYVQVSWTYPGQADAYDLEYRPVGDALWETYVDGLTGSQTSLNVPDLVAGQTYQFRVRADHAGGQDSFWSDAGTEWSDPAGAAAGAEATAKTSDNGAEDDNQFPIQVVSPAVTATPIGNGQLRISWSATGSATTGPDGRVDPDQYGWYISDSPNDTSWSEIPARSFGLDWFQDVGTQTSVVANVPAGWHYGVVVVAHNSASVVPDANGDGGYTSPYSRRLGYGSATGVMPGDTPTVPTAPAGLHVTIDPSGNGQLHVHWQNTPNNEEGFRLERKLTSSNSWQVIAETGADGTATTYTSPGGPDDWALSYDYRVVAFNSTGTSAPCEVDGICFAKAALLDVLHKISAEDLSIAKELSAVILKVAHTQAKFAYYTSMFDKINSTNVGASNLQVLFDLPAAAGSAGSILLSYANGIVNPRLLLPAGVAAGGVSIATGLKTALNASGRSMIYLALYAQYIKADLKIEQIEIIAYTLQQVQNTSSSLNFSQNNLTAFFNNAVSDQVAVETRIATVKPLPDGPAFVPEYIAMKAALAKLKQFHVANSPKWNALSAACDALLAEFGEIDTYYPQPAGL